MPEVIPLYTPWQALLNASESMLELARNEDWLSLAEKDIERQTLLKQYFAGKNSDIPDLLQVERIQQLQAIDEELLSQCLAGREDTATELQNIHRGKTADRAYLGNAS
ncbi:flagellar protein FliT [Sulfuriflexus sp.]|uniref:flagellar protein FliT n=1 Tax=Sulfuriflexus sp. TaxID=2015443 RepID=UPI0028CDDE29|nr:flagellar protein FliT [Sulfuriflexus sp.]MDT8404477.1 flagellar protein FliT [Sulfuriflexus sp.]